MNSRGGSDDDYTSVSEEVVEETEELTDSVHFGQMIDAEGALTIDEFASQMEGKDSMNVKIAAVATDVCQKKGCWMKVQLADGSEMRIRFKDYGFFVPKTGVESKLAFISGNISKDTISVERLRHYAEDAGKSSNEIEKIVKPEFKLSFIADGVAIKTN